MICQPIPHLVAFVAYLAALARQELSAAEEVAMAERKRGELPSQATCAWLDEASGAVRMAQRAEAAVRELNAR